MSPTDKEAYEELRLRLFPGTLPGYETKPSDLEHAGWIIDKYLVELLKRLDYHETVELIDRTPRY